MEKFYTCVAKESGNIIAKTLKKNALLIIGAIAAAVIALAALCGAVWLWNNHTAEILSVCSTILSAYSNILSDDGFFDRYGLWICGAAIAVLVLEVPVWVVIHSAMKTCISRASTTQAADETIRHLRRIRGNADKLFAGSFVLVLGSMVCAFFLKLCSGIPDLFMVLMICILGAAFTMLAVKLVADMPDEPAEY